MEDDVFVMYNNDVFMEAIVLEFESLFLPLQMKEDVNQKIMALKIA
jgi:hypothetical protein